MSRFTYGVLVVLWIWWPVAPLLAQTENVDSDLLKQGILEFENAAYEESLMRFQQLLEQDSLHAEAHAWLARTYKVLGKHIKAANQARLAVSDDPNNISYLVLRYQIGFVQPTVLDLARKRGLLKRILELDPENAFAHTELGREQALVYIHNKDRIRIPDFEPQPSPLGQGMPNVRRNISLDAPVLVRDPFDLGEVRGQGYTIVNEGKRAEEALENALRHLYQAIQTDPVYRPSYDPLMAVLALSGRYQRMHLVASRMKRYLPGDPYAYLYAGYAAYKLKNLFVAQRDFAKGRALLVPSDSVVFNDVQRILNKQEVRAGNADVSMDAYWEGKDPLQLTSGNERQLEHDARLVFAHLLFGEPKLNMKGWDAERGEVFVRFGEPRQMYYLSMRAEDCNISGNVSPEGLNSGISDVTNFHVFDYGDKRFVFGQSGNFGGSSGTANARIPILNEYPLYSTCSSANASSWSLGADLDYVTRTKGIIRETPNEYRLPGNVISFPYLATRFKGDSKKADVWVTYGFPLGEPESQPAGDSEDLFMLGLEAGAFLISHSGSTADAHRRTMGSVYRDELQSYEGAFLWPGSHHLEAEAGSYDLAVEFERKSDATLGVNKEPLDIPDFHTSDFLMSDIMLAYFIEEAIDRTFTQGVVTREGLDIHAAPWGVYENGKPVYFYFELYNLKENAPGLYEYEVEAALIVQNRNKKGLFTFRRNKKDAVAVQFTRTSSTANVHEYLALETETIKSGNYTLIVTVTEKASGQSVEARREIFVR